MTGFFAHDRPDGPLWRRRDVALAVVGRTGFFVVVWWALSRDLASAWLVAPIAVAAALLVSLRVAPPGPTGLSLLGLARFVPFFLWQSLRGGVDVVVRALHPRLPIRPGFVDYTANLPPGPAVAWFAVTVSLLPGSLAARVDEQRFVVHVLDTAQPVPAMLARVEARVRAVFANAGPAGTPVPVASER